MLRKLTFAVAIAATVLLSLASTTLAAPAAVPKVVVEAINEHNIHEEPDGTIIETWVVGTRRTVTYAGGRIDMTEQYTMDQTAKNGSSLLYDSSASTKSRVVYRGELTFLYRLTSHTDMRWGDGRDCDIDTRFLVVRNRLVFHEQIGPVCTTT